MQQLWFKREANPYGSAMTIIEIVAGYTTLFEFTLKDYETNNNTYFIIIIPFLINACCNDGNKK